MKTASTTWTQAEWDVARAMARRRPPEEGEKPIGELLEELRRERDERRRERRQRGVRL